MEKISFTEMLGRHGLREENRLKKLSIGGVATKELELDETTDFIVDGGEGLVDRAIQDPAS